jgi:hypothetical protein
LALAKNVHDLLGHSVLQPPVRGSVAEGNIITIGQQEFALGCGYSRFEGFSKRG